MATKKLMTEWRNKAGSFVLESIDGLSLNGRWARWCSSGVCAALNVHPWANRMWVQFGSEGDLPYHLLQRPSFPSNNPCGWVCAGKQKGRIKRQLFNALTENNLRRGYMSAWYDAPPVQKGPVTWRLRCDALREWLESGGYELVDPDKLVGDLTLTYYDGARRAGCVPVEVLGDEIFHAAGRVDGVLSMVPGEPLIAPESLALDRRWRGSLLIEGDYLEKT